MKLLKIFTIIIFNIFIFACASSPSDLDRNSLKENKISIIEFKSIKHLYENNYGKRNAYYGKGEGLNDGVFLIHSGRKKYSINNTIAALGNYDLNQVFKNKLESIKSPLFNVNLSVKEVDKISKKHKSIQTISISQSIFSLSYDRRSIIGQLNIWIKPSESSKLYNQIYINQLDIPINELELVDRNIPRYWVENPEELKKNIELLMDKIITQFVNDIS